MSIEYYRLKRPVTHLELAEGTDFNCLTVYVNDGLSGVLNLPNAVTGLVLQMFADQGHGAVLFAWGSSDRGIAVEDYTGLHDSTIVISACGELLTAGQVRALAGKGRRDR